MTDTIPFAPPTSVDEPAPSDRKKLVAMCAAGALVLAAGGYLLLGGGGGDTQASSNVAPVPHIVKSHVVANKPADKPATKPVAGKPASLPAASTARLGRDPFKALVTVPKAATGPAAGTTGTTAAAPASASGTTTGTTAGSAPGSSAGSTGAQAQPSYSLQLKSVKAVQGSTYRYTFAVAGATKSVVAGQKFGNYGELVVLAVVANRSGAATGALVQVGDADPHSISIGEKATVA